MTPPTAANAALVTLFLPPVARVRVVDGTPVAAATNTGCAPRATDAVVLESGQPATTGLAADVLRCSRAGDWTEPGRWVALAC